jgi:hypothetical protein
MVCLADIPHRRGNLLYHFLFADGTHSEKENQNPALKYK